MNKDASTFPLSVVEHVLKSHINTLPLKRLKDYLVRMDGGTQINGVVWQLRLWNSAVVIPANLDVEWKAFSVTINQNPKLNAPDVKGKPRVIELDELVMVCPHDDSTLWFCQESKFFPEKGSTYHYNGRSRIYAINEEMLIKILSRYPGAAKKLWEQYIAWVSESITTRKNIISQHERLKDSLIAQI